MNYWLHRISYYNNVAVPLLQKGYLTIGFSDFASKQFLSDASENWVKFEETIKSSWMHKSRRRYFLWRFISEMKKRDRILVPRDECFDIYEIVDDNVLLFNELEFNQIEDRENKKISWKNSACPKYEDETKIDLGFLRKVEPVRTGIKRSDYADSRLTSRMKYRATNIGINDLKESVDKAIAANDDCKSIIEKSILLEDTKIKQKLLKVIIDNFDPDSFEKLIRWYFYRIGADAVDILPKNEREKNGDIDVVAYFSLMKTTIHVQAKHHTGMTRSDAVQQVIEFKKDKQFNIEEKDLPVYWVISTADSFSENAQNEAVENSILLIDGKHFVEMLLDAGFNGYNHLNL